jgi:4-hydroxybenzoate polyprenyltransferase
MEKLNQKTEEGILIVLALMVLFSSMFNPTVSIVLAVIGLVVVFSYNILTRKK